MCVSVCVFTQVSQSLLIKPGRAITARIPSDNIAIYFTKSTINCGFPGASVVVNLPANAGDTGDTGLIPGSLIPWRRKWQPTPVFLPGESHGQRSLAGYRP